MAQALIQKQHPEFNVFSAGTHPAPAVHPLAIDVMAEKGIDLRNQIPSSVDLYLNRNFDHVISVCGEAHETCPVFLGRVIHRNHVGFFDPALAQGSHEDRLKIFRQVRDEIEATFSNYSF